MTAFLALSLFIMLFGSSDDVRMDLRKYAGYKISHTKINIFLPKVEKGRKKEFPKLVVIGK